MATDLAQFARKNGVKYFMISYTDLFSGQRAKLVPAAAIGDMQKEGAGFAGFATWLDLTPAHPDMLAVPDPDSVIQLPWKPEVAWVAANCVMEDKSVAQAPRDTLRRLVAEAASEGMRVKTGVEAEFFLITRDGRVDYATPSARSMFGRDIAGESFDHLVRRHPPGHGEPTRSEPPWSGVEPPWSYVEDGAEGYVAATDGTVVTVTMRRRDGIREVPMVPDGSPSRGC